MCVARPAQVQPGFAFSHLFLTEVNLPTGDVALSLAQELLNACNALVGNVGNQLVAGHLAAGNLVTIDVQNNNRIYVAESIFHKDAVLELRVQQSAQRTDIRLVNELRVVQEARGAPHVTYGVVGGLHIFLLLLGYHLLEHTLCKRCYEFGIVGQLAEVLVDRLQQSAAKHTLNDILRRADHVIILVTDLDLSEHRLVDVEGLIDNFHILAGLLFVPCGELVKDVVHVNVIRPVVHLQGVCAISGLGEYRARHKRCHDKNDQGSELFVHFFCLFNCLLV